MHSYKAKTYYVCYHGVLVSNLTDGFTICYSHFVSSLIPYYSCCHNEIISTGIIPTKLLIFDCFDSVQWRTQELRLAGLVIQLLNSIWEGLVVFLFVHSSTFEVLKSQILLFSFKDIKLIIITIIIFF